MARSARLKFVVAYDGAPFVGWQSQRGGNTVQDYLERAFACVIGRPRRIHGAGRTDAGVHALAQTAHIDLPDRSIDAHKWPAALNASLPPQIRVLRSAYVSEKFHARFSARGKIYRYRIWHDRVLPPFEVGRAWQVVTPLDFPAMEAEAAAFLGRHDFASFAANRGTPETDTRRTITKVKLSAKGKALTIEIAGNGFLYKMVRLMVGALVRRGSGQAAAGELRTRLLHPECVSSARFVAPAAGLVLVRVLY